MKHAFSALLLAVSPTLFAFTFSNPTSHPVFIEYNAPSSPGIKYATVAPKELKFKSQDLLPTTAYAIYIVHYQDDLYLYTAQYRGPCDTKFELKYDRFSKKTIFYYNGMHASAQATLKP
jgi:hypothetical protein